MYITNGQRLMTRKRDDVKYMKNCLQNGAKRVQNESKKNFKCYFPFGRDAKEKKKIPLNPRMRS